jgi:hypothetical protein
MGTDNNDDDIWRSLGALEAQGEERTKQMERLFVILGDVKYESSKIAACVESLSSQFKQHMTEVAHDFESISKRVKDAEENCQEKCAKFEHSSELFVDKENVEALRSAIGVWKMLTKAVQGALTKVLVVVFTGAAIGAATHFGLKVSLGN